ADSVRNGNRLPENQWKSISIYGSGRSQSRFCSQAARKPTGRSDMCSPPASRLQRAAIVVALERQRYLRARKMKLGNLAVNYPTSGSCKMQKQSLRALSVEQGDGLVCRKSTDCDVCRPVALSLSRKPNLKRALHSVATGTSIRVDLQAIGEGRRRALQ